MGDKIRVVLLDDHPLVLEGLKNRLEKEPDIVVPKTFDDPRDLLEDIASCQADVLVMDIAMPHLSGFELGKQLKEQYGLSLKIILLSGYTYDEFYSKAYEIGAHAFLSKQSTYAQIINAIKQSMLGHALVAEKVLGKSRDVLTAVEREVLVRIAEEKTNKEIAQELAMSQRTVEHHMTSINQKLGVKSRVGAVSKGYESGLLGSIHSGGADED
ncbi:response regulator transcription factor [Paenibacillus radicis (ex Gao et al. 2016)]|uniref:DNA-binding response regulator n=1 Tax=Paenibacillus radicis (ex Gao et al. 2016) TaxID=1737354 RepID=A0A917LSI2_9BACL|nr:response regulator transcription factor [Paenibacillus radicis (ex Gao et al. 2016)]GGG53959.1 DNA-binding response regulator [Paenibacillus radicis (ex Gao et al. 2016)]